MKTYTINHYVSAISEQRINGVRTKGVLYSSLYDEWFMVQVGRSTSARLYHRHGNAGKFHSQGESGKPHELAKYIQKHYDYKYKEL